jgi:NADPH:quinone reductase-like Zn-dependent oxidoreductase
VTQRNIPKIIPQTAQALWTVGPGQLEIRETRLPGPDAGSLRIRALWSAVSLGTERLVLAGDVPESERERMRAPFQEGEFPFPVKYGYACVGEVAGGDASRLGEIVFCLYPHQSLFNIPAGAAVPVPADVPPLRAILAANMETALNGLWDGNASPGDHIAVVGGGVVGLLVARLCAQLPGTRVTLVDTDPAKEEPARALGAGFAMPANAPAGQDLVFHASGHPAGLDTALALAGTEATVVEMSWYGTKPVTATLGGGFHSQRLTLRSSQVGRIPPGRQARWTHRRRLETALSLLRDPALDILLSSPIRLIDAPQALPDILAGRRVVLAQPIAYG